MTDIGNDLLYGVPPDQLLEWVAACIDRLATAGATTIVTQMPTGSIEGLSEARYRFFRGLLFPRSSLALADAKSMVRSFNDRLIRLGEARKLPVIPVSKSWYGFDPIHLKRRVLRQAWPILLATWRAAEEPLSVVRPSLWLTAYLARLAPCEQSLFGVRRRGAQPSGRLADGTTISLY